METPENEEEKMVAEPLKSLTNIPEPETFDTIQWHVTEESQQEIINFCGGPANVNLDTQTEDDSLVVQFPKFNIHLGAFDWLVRDSNGNYSSLSNEDVKSSIASGSIIS